MILLVEDDPADARLIQRALAQAGVDDKVLRLTNGVDVVSYLRGDHPYDNRHSYPIPVFMLLDIKLPKKNGFEVLEWIRGQATALRRMPIVMMTSSRHSADVNRAYDLGVNSYLVKPDSTEQLLGMAKLIRAYWLNTNENPPIGAAKRDIV